MLNKIIYVQGSNAFGGLEKITQVYESTFRKYNPLVVILQYLDNGLDYKNFHKFKRKNRISFIIEYYKYIKERKKSIFHLQSGGTHVLLLTYVSGARKIIYHFHGISKKNLVEKLIWKYLDSRTKKIVNSNHTKKEIIKNYNIHKNFYVIPNFINEKEFIYSKRVLTDSKFKVVYAGRLTKGKNLVLLLETIKVLRPSINDFEFVIIGDGEERETLISKIKELSIEDDVKLLPFTKDIKRVYNQSNLFIFLSLYESFGNVVAEAVLTGLPVLCHKIPALTELINDEIFFIKELNPEIIAEQIIWYKKNYSEVIERLSKVHNYIKNHLNNEKIITCLEKIYEEF